MDTLDVARSVATANPQSRLPCPGCGVSVNATNLESHVAKVHPKLTPSAPPWRGKGFLGLFPCSIEFDGDAMVLKHYLGLARRRVPLPCTIEIGTLVGLRPDPIMASHQEINVEAETVRVGNYLRLVNGAAITIACRQDTMFGVHWRRELLQAGPRRSRWDVMLSRQAVAAIEYELAHRGVLAAR